VCILGGIVLLALGIHQVKSCLCPEIIQTVARDDRRKLYSNNPSGADFWITSDTEFFFELFKNDDFKF
jgi:hypothetical protein